VEEEKGVQLSSGQHSEESDVSEVTHQPKHDRPHKIACGRGMGHGGPEATDV
jgi:hypothetical protein